MFDMRVTELPPSGCSAAPATLLGRLSPPQSVHCSPLLPDNNSINDSPIHRPIGSSFCRKLQHHRLLVLVPVPDQSPIGSFAFVLVGLQRLRQLVLVQQQHQHWRLGRARH